MKFKVFSLFNLFQLSVSLLTITLIMKHVSLGYDVKDVGVIVADVSDESSLNAMCSSAKIILNCVGPVMWTFFIFLKLS